MPERAPRKLPLLSMMFALSVSPGMCSKARRAANADAGTSSPSTATVTSAPSPAASTSETAAAAAASAAARSAAVGRATQAVDDIRWMISKGVTVNREKAGEGDVATKCDAVESMRASSARDPDPEFLKVLDEGASLCAFDVPLLTASESLDHLRGTPSQASRLLMCNVAAREIAKARAVRPNDPRVRSAEARRIATCNK